MTAEEAIDRALSEAASRADRIQILLHAAETLAYMERTDMIREASARGELSQWKELIS